MLPETVSLKNFSIFLHFCNISFQDPDHTILELPALSPTMDTGVIAKWAVKVGDKVTGGSNLAKIETDKSAMDWDSVDDGILSLNDIIISYSFFL